MIQLSLSDDERTELRARFRDRKMDVQTQTRLRMVELSGLGLSPPTIARRVGRHENTVRKFLKRFRQERFAALPKRTSPGRPPRIREEHFRALEALLDGSARTFTSAQMAAWMQTQFDLSVHPRYLAQCLKQRGWRYKRTKAVWPTKNRRRLL
jgi:transposase